MRHMALSLTLCLAACGSDTSVSRIRVGQYNIELLNTFKLSDQENAQVDAAVQVINRFTPDIIAINEIQYPVTNDSMPGDRDYGETNARTFANRLSAAGGPKYDHVVITLGNWGYKWDGYDSATHDAYFRSTSNGSVPGAINSAIISRYPIVRDQVRVIVDVPWGDLQDSKVAELQQDLGVSVPAGYPVFSNALVVVPVDVEGTIVYMVLLHTTPPLNPEINKYRNRDQLLGLRQFVDGQLPNHDGLPTDARFVLAGDFNADPDHGDGFMDTIQSLLSHPSLATFNPTGAGTVGVNPEFNTTASVCPSDGSPDPAGGKQFRLDYLLPSKTLGDPIDGALFYPSRSDAPEDWKLACGASNHMFLWAELSLN
ncbi:MAG: endonuclease/exonuclease/phosphatase family protein [Myxococcales bacterium]|nr:endonuclease/exonuclease/phosphatase family protein [Myxococcales bacterium]